jgi:hypothetical protein
MNDIISIIADAIQNHEGWLVGEGTSYPNLNPGNLDFVGQAGAVANGRFAKFSTFYAGRQALENDIKAKLNAGIDTIKDLIDLYAPPIENNTNAYVVAVSQFFAWRNVSLTQTTPLHTLVLPAVVVIDFNDLYQPTDWHVLQQAVSQCATYMPQYAFVVRYTNANLNGSIIQMNQPLISATTSVISGGETASVLKTVNYGEPLNVLVYNGSVMQGHPTPAGGCEYQKITLSPTSAISSVMYQGAAFVDPTARIIFHELIHELFDVTNQVDILHAYLITHSGYAENSADDLRAVYNGGQLNSPQAVVTLAGNEVQEVQNSDIPLPEKVSLLQKVANIIKSLL